MASWVSFPAVPYVPSVPLVPSVPSVPAVRLVLFSLHIAQLLSSEEFLPGWLRSRLRLDVSFLPCCFADIPISSEGCFLGFFRTTIFFLVLSLFILEF